MATLLPRVIRGAGSALRAAAWLLLAPLLYLARGPARGLLAVLGFLGIACAFGGLLGIRSALDAGQPLWEPLGMIWGGGAVGALCLGLRAHIPRMWNHHN
jgi:hypothetical protein